MESKKIYKIGDNIKEEELTNVSKGIVIKALKVIESSGNNWSSRIIEGKDKDTLQDLIQTVALVLIENNYKITKDTYKSVNKYMYNYKINNIKNIEIIVNDENASSNLDKKSYIEYIKEENNISYNKIEYNKKITLDSLRLTSKQLEILNIYSKINSMQGVADILGITKSTVQTTINRIKQKTQKIICSVEY